MHALGAPGELRGCSGGVPGTLQGGSGPSREPPGTARAPPERDLLGSEATSETLWEDASKTDAFWAVLASIFRPFWVDSLLASLLVSVTLDSLRGTGDTLEFDDPYEGFATFPVGKKMQLRSGTVGKHSNLDSERGLRIEVNFRWMGAPFGDDFGTVFTRKSSRRACK